jgi:hypothetical protein
MTLNKGIIFVKMNCYPTIKFELALQSSLTTIVIQRCKKMFKDK